MINYQRVIAYLDAIAAQARQDINNSPHLTWWRHSADGSALTYAEFKSGTITGPPLIPAPIPILEPADPAVDKSQSVFYKILIGPTTYHGTAYTQMPKGGFFITSSASDAGTGTDTAPGTNVFTLADGSTVTGKQIQDDLLTWLKGGAPEN